MFINGMKLSNFLIDSLCPLIYFLNNCCKMWFSDHAKEDSLIAFIMAFVHILIPV